MVFDLHCDTIWKIQKTDGASLKNGSVLQIDAKKLERAKYFAQCFAMYVPADTPNPYDTLQNLIARYYQEIETCQNIKPAVVYEDLICNQKAGIVSSVLTMEDACSLESDLNHLYDVYDKGVRMIGLTWNYPNEVGFPNYQNFVRGKKPDMFTAETQRGLTDFGFSLVEEMNRLGIVVDVSHLSDKGFDDVLSVTKKPIMASHSNARGLCRNVRNLTDEMLRRLSDNGGVVGINFAAGFLCEDEEKGKQTVEYAVQHVKYIRDKIGVDNIAIGSDFDGISPDIELSDCSKMPLLLEGLERNGFTAEEIEKIAYKNALRVFHENLK